MPGNRAGEDISSLRITLKLQPVATAAGGLKIAAGRAAPLASDRIAEGASGRTLELERERAEGGGNPPRRLPLGVFQVDAVRPVPGKET